MDSKNNRKIREIENLCNQFPELTIKEIADHLGFVVEEVYLLIKSQGIHYHWKLKTEHEKEELIAV